MATSHGRSADVFGNGYVLSSYLNSCAVSGSREAAETTTFGKNSKTYIPGLKDTSWSIEGLYDGDIDAIDQILWAALENGTTGLFSYFPMGEGALGRLAYTMDTIESSYEITTDVGDVAQISAELAAGEFGRFYRGRVLSPMSVKAAGGNSSSIDNTAQTTNGGALVVHATAASTLVVKLQDSADNSTFADVAGGTISISSGRSSQRLVLSGTIRRYTRALWTGTGTFDAIVERY
jgi:hypothetical protein